MIAHRDWDARYEWKAVLLLSLGFGLVGIDRFLILPMFPVLMKELHLDYTDLGHITGILAITWGISSLFMGRLADKVGRKRIVVWSMVAFSLLAGFSGLMHGLVGLLIVRALLGVAEGAYTPPSITATLEASKPSRHGLNLGIQQAAMPLFGLALAPILVTQLLQIMDWRLIFFLVSVPGLVIAYLLWRTLRPAGQADRTTAPGPTPSSREKPGRKKMFAYRNVPLNMLGMLCWLTCLIVSSALMPSYLMDHLRLTLQQMGLVMSALGFGATLGTIAIPAISDRVGRKPVMILSVIAAIGFLFGLVNTGAHPAQLFAMLFGTCFFNFALICLTVGPITAEAVPAELRASASGTVVGVGEIFGGGVAPVIGGYIATVYGIQYIPYLAIAGLVVGIGVTLSLKETAPARTAPKAVGALP